MEKSMLNQVLETYKQQLSAMQQQIDFALEMKIYYLGLLKSSSGDVDEYPLSLLCVQFLKFYDTYENLCKQKSSLLDELHSIEKIISNDLLF